MVCVGTGGCKIPRAGLVLCCRGRAAPGQAFLCRVQTWVLLASWQSGVKGTKPRNGPCSAAGPWEEGEVGMGATSLGCHREP